MSSKSDDLAPRVKADRELRQSARDPISSKIAELRRLNIRGQPGGSMNAPYRGWSFRVMACAMAAAWEYGQLNGRAGDDLEFWFRDVVDKAFVDGEIVGLDPVIVACAEFVVEQIMALANEPYSGNVTPRWTLHDLGTLCIRLAQARDRNEGGGGGSSVQG